MSKNLIGKMVASYKNKNHATEETIIGMIIDYSPVMPKGTSKVSGRGFTIEWYYGPQTQVASYYTLHDVDTLMNNYEFFRNGL